ncbi:hypothetical protein SAPIO_CDS7889 [Scedosporium apiospermum]|uniref:Uncharacterized protein n=1 Tax=Pseudallescheria apiosperma TaxID=563466 RepID=A0A084G0M9_PSEDA|nr:uncharacterized protein SAPIO_CDS7889 [Scedosporium apiospermum]KEZ40891.1 hypothetical protein SAPIO_CDS7889 [Scedosporium apiospermum]
MEKTNLPRPLDENLPEVVPDSSPEVIPKNATAFYENHLGDRYPKYPVIADDTPKYVGGYEASATADPVSPYPDSPAPSHGYEQAQAAGYPLPPAEKKILGLKKRTFWIVAITVLIILAAALGGGLGGGGLKCFDPDRKPEPNCDNWVIIAYLNLELGKSDGNLPQRDHARGQLRLPGMVGKRLSRQGFSRLA